MVVTDPVTIALSKNDSPFDADKVATLKAAIASGAYRMDHDALARAIIGFDRAAVRQIFDFAAPSEN